MKSGRKSRIKNPRLRPNLKLRKNKLLARALKDLQTWPLKSCWLEAGLLWIVFVAVAWPLARHYDFVLSPIGFSTWLPMAVNAVFIPSFVEEFIWRGLLSPKIGSRYFWPLSGLSLVAYVLSHPLGAWLFRPTAQDIFYHPAFLLLTALLGLLCLTAYLRSGSLWPGIAIHWLTVAGWLLFDGRTLLET